MDDVKPFHVINEWNCQCCGNDDRVVLLWWCSVHIVSYMLEQVIACDITHRLELSFICLTRDSLFVGILSVGVHDDGINDTMYWNVISFHWLLWQNSQKTGKTMTHYPKRMPQFLLCIHNRLSRTAWYWRTKRHSLTFHQQSSKRFFPSTRGKLPPSPVCYTAEGNTALTGFWTCTSKLERLLTAFVWSTCWTPWNNWCNSSWWAKLGWHSCQLLSLCRVHLSLPPYAYSRLLCDGFHDIEHPSPHRQDPFHCILEHTTGCLRNQNCTESLGLFITHTGPHFPPLLQVVKVENDINTGCLRPMTSMTGAGIGEIHRVFPVMCTVPHLVHPLIPISHFQFPTTHQPHPNHPL